MQAAIELPGAFSVRDDNEFYPIEHLISRLNPKLAIARVASGRHINGGPTVLWGVVYLEGKPPTDKLVKKALKKAGLDFENSPVLKRVVIS